MTRKGDKRKDLCERTVELIYDSTEGRVDPSMMSLAKLVRAQVAGTTDQRL